MRNLHELPTFRDRWSYLYLEHGDLDQQGAGLVFHNKAAFTPIPIDQLSLLMLGPGTNVTHAAVKALAGNNCLLAWVGEEGSGCTPIVPAVRTVLDASSFKHIW